MWFFLVPCGDVLFTMVICIPPMINCVPLLHTPSDQKGRPNFWLKSYSVRIDQLCGKNDRQLQYQISIIKYIIKYMFILYLFSIVVIDSFSYNFDQTLHHSDLSQKL